MARLRPENLIIGLGKRHQPEGIGDYDRDKSGDLQPKARSDRRNHVQLVLLDKLDVVDLDLSRRVSRNIELKNDPTDVHFVDPRERAQRHQHGAHILMPIEGKGHVRFKRIVNPAEAADS